MADRLIEWIDKELTERVGEIRRQRRITYGYVRPTRPKVFVLSDILFCGVCGQSLKGNSYKGQRLYRHKRAKRGCPEKWITADKVEAEVLGMLRDFLSGPFFSIVEGEIQRLVDSEARGPESRALRGKIEGGESRLDRLEELYLDQEISRARYVSRRAKIEAEINSARDELQSRVGIGDLEGIVERLRGSIGDLGGLDAVGQKAAINSVFERLELSGGRVIKSVPRDWARGFFFV